MGYYIQIKGKYIVFLVKDDKKKVFLQISRKNLVLCCKCLKINIIRYRYIT